VVVLCRREEDHRIGTLSFELASNRLHQLVRSAARVALMGDRLDRLRHLQVLRSARDASTMKPLA
jgi:hypothetical protein